MNPIELVLIAYGLVTLIMIFGLYRIGWVYTQRIKLIDKDALDQYASYDTMLDRWWVWDIEQFRIKQ